MLSANVTSPRGSQTFAGSVTLADDVTVKAGKVITFASTVDGDSRLTVSAGGPVAFLGAVGGAESLAGVTLARAAGVAFADGFNLDGTAAAAGPTGLLIARNVNSVVFLPSSGPVAREITGFAGAGIRFVGGSRNSLITGVSSLGNGIGLLIGPGVYTGTQIVGNTFAENAGNGITMTAARGITLGGAGANGNTIIFNGGWGLVRQRHLDRLAALGQPDQRQPPRQRGGPRHRPLAVVPGAGQDSRRAVGPGLAGAAELGRLGISQRHATRPLLVHHRLRHQWRRGWLDRLARLGQAAGGPRRDRRLVGASASGGGFRHPDHRVPAARQHDLCRCGPARRHGPALGLGDGRVAGRRRRHQPGRRPDAPGHAPGARVPDQLPVRRQRRLRRAVRDHDRQVELRGAPAAGGPHRSRHHARIRQRRDSRGGVAQQAGLREPVRRRDPRPGHDHGLACRLRSGRPGGRASEEPNWRHRLGLGPGTLR